MSDLGPDSGIAFNGQDMNWIVGILATLDPEEIVPPEARTVIHKAKAIMAQVGEAGMVSIRVVK